MIYQLGACPCGCLENNAWIHLLEIGSDHHLELMAAPSNSAVVVLAESGHHDCTGEPRPTYFDNARPIELAAGFLNRVEPILSIIVDAPVERSTSLYCFQQRKRTLALAHALTRSDLQVYRL